MDRGVGDDRIKGKDVTMRSTTDRWRTGGSGGPGRDTEPGRWPPPRRFGSRLAGLAIGAGAVVVVVVLLVAGLLRFTAWHPTLTNPFGTRTINRTQPVLLVSLQNLSVYKAATGNFQLIVNSEKDARFIPSFIKGERTLFVAAGSVDAEVDFSRIDKDAIKVSDNGKTAEITLPAPALGKVRIDPNASYIASQERGIIDRLGSVVSQDPNRERQLYQLAEQQIRDAAQRSDLLARAEQNTRATLQGMLRSLGYTKVTVDFTRSRPAN
jgi:Protein of unknown function (DUF4230)